MEMTFLGGSGDLHTPKPNQSNQITNLPKPTLSVLFLSKFL